jgi:AraC family transcriptional regulator
MPEMSQSWHSTPIDRRGRLDYATFAAPQFDRMSSSQGRISAVWDPFSLFEVETPLYAKAAFADYALGVYLHGRHRIQRRIDGRSVQGWSDRGTINFSTPGVGGEWEASGSSRAAVLLLPAASVSRAISEHWGADPGRVEISPQFLVRDPVIEHLTTRLMAEARQGSPSGTLYAESAFGFLAHHLIRSYSSLSAPPSHGSGGLGGRRLKVVLDYIESCFATPISLLRLAELAGVGTRHFERAFQKSVGLPPHAYLLAKRIAAARELLLDRPNLSVHEIAARVGFSSSSHLASAFRRQTGYSPTAYRRYHSG